MTLDPARVAAAGAAWTYVPEGSREVATPEYRLVAYPSWSSAGVVLLWLGPLRRTVRQVVDEVREVLLRGGVLVDEVQVLAAPVDDALARIAPPDDVVVEVVDSLADLRAATDIGAVAFDTAPLDDDELADALRADTEMPEAAWFLARLLPEGTPVGSAGATLDDAVVRLWAGAVLPEARRRGVHRALLDARLRTARLRDADLALAKGHLDASVPTLLRSGFRAFGSDRDYRLPLR